MAHRLIIGKCTKADTQFIINTNLTTCLIIFHLKILQDAKDKKIKTPYSNLR